MLASIPNCTIGYIEKISICRKISIQPFFKRDQEGWRGTSWLRSMSRCFSELKMQLFFEVCV